ncbi:MAG: penicillin acylase family protein [Candidatus Thermoplasmatota archaeon]|nr:penicillin acylase family protein [Candidatus Thermoplasmatota archaeon]
MKQKIIIFVFISTLLISSFSSALPSQTFDLRNDFKITRDKWGIAHIIADTDEAAFYAAGYVTAEDRLFQMHRNRRAVQGRLAELIAYDDSSVTSEIVAQDVYMRHRGLYRYAKTMESTLDETYTSLLQAYCNGVNQFITEHKNELHSLFDGQVPEEWTIADCIASWDRLGDYFSGFPSSEVNRLHEFENLVETIGYNQAIKQMTTERIVDDSAATTKYEDYDPETIQAIFKYAENITNQQNNIISDISYHFSPKMSHAWVVSGEKTTTGSAVLSSDPQTKVTAPSIWYEIHMKGESFNVRGIGVAGCPGFLVGWNEHVAWGATALGADQADLYRLDMIDEQTYMYDGERYKIDISDETIIVKNGRDRRISVKETFIGPVVTELLPSAKENEEYVLCAFPEWDKNHHSIEALIDMISATDVYDFYNAIQTYRNPGIHCVFGDNSGNIGYSIMAGIPLRSNSFPFSGSVAQPGNSSRYSWVEMIPYEVLPHVFNPSDGVLFSANHLPVGSWYPIHLHLGQGGSGDGSRSWRLRELLNTTDKVFSPEEIYQVHYDTVDPRIREIIHIGLYIKEQVGNVFSVDANHALDLLESWYENGAKCVSTEPYYAAAHHMDLYFREQQWLGLTSIYGGGDSGLCLMLKTIKNSLAAYGFYEFNQTEIDFFDYVLSTGYSRAVQNYGSDPDEWINGFQSFGPAKYTVEYFGTLENFGSLDRSLDKSYEITNVNGGTIGGQMGQSYSQWVDLAKVNNSRAILPIGNMEDPTNPHFDDQEDIWLNLEMRDSPLEHHSKQKNTKSNQSIEELYSNIEFIKSLKLLQLMLKNLIFNIL